MKDNPWLRRSAQTLYPRGSVVVCPNCYRPVWVLERGISAQDRPGSSASAFRPLTLVDVRELADRWDIDTMWRQSLVGWAGTDAGYAVLQAARPRAGDIMDCPNPHCDGVWALYGHRNGELNVHDRNYTLSLMTIPPMPAGMKRLGPKWKMDPHPREADLVIEERPA